MQTLLRISRFIDAMNERIGRFAYWLILGMVLVGVWNVVGRYVGRAIGQNLTSNALIETQWYIFDLVFLLGGAYTLKHGGHVRVDVFYSNWSPKRQAFVNFLGTLLFLIPFCLLVIFVSWNPVLISWQGLEISPDPGGLPRYPLKTVIPICFVLLIFQGISEAIKNWAVFINPSPSEPGHD
ncbi:MAG: TRAP transporter small permease subunit [Cyanothece sp. SIO1E1]|nr:TRAP transporter small permease subunit [Cyanothece sp. SIO1E1]